MNPLRVVIADDEPFARDRLRVLLSSMAPDVIFAGQAGDAQQLFALLDTVVADVVILDIAMPGMNGLDVAKQLHSITPQSVIIFCTAYDAHAIAAFNVQAVDYLLKPVRITRLASALARAQTFFAGQRQRNVDVHSGHTSKLLRARLGGTVRLIGLEDIRYVHAHEKYVIAYHSAGQSIIDGTLKSLEKSYPTHWVRIHRNCLVARNQLSTLFHRDRRIWVVLRNVPDPLEVSRRCLRGLREQLRLS